MGEPSTSSVVNVLDLRCRVECPVCFEIFRTPKSLNCGHSVCQECSEQLMDMANPLLVQFVIQCPVCRAANPIPQEGLPTNFNLADLVNQVVSQESKKLFECASCDKKYSATDTWICHSCGKNSLFCSTCSLKEHRGHTLQELEDLLMNRRKELDLWKEKVHVSRDQRGLQMRNRDVTSEANRMALRLQSLAHLLQKGSEEWVRNRSREIFKVSRDINKIYAEHKTGDVKLVTLNVVECQLQNEKEMQNISEKQQKISNEQEAIVTLLSEMDEKIKTLDEWRPNFKSAVIETAGTCHTDDFDALMCSGSPRKFLRLSEGEPSTPTTPSDMAMSPSRALSNSPHYIQPPGAVSDSDNSQD